MMLTDFAGEALRSLVRAKLRTCIGLAGISIGIASIITMLTIGEIATNEARAQFESLGTDILILRFTPKSDEHLDPKDAMNFARLNPSVSIAAPVAVGTPQISYSEHPIDARTLKGVTEDYLEINRLTMAQGRFLSNLDAGSLWCVIGSDVAKAIRRLGLLDVVGAHLLINGQYHKVLGVLAHSEPNYALSYQNNANSSVYVHLMTMWDTDPATTADTIIARSAKGMDPDAATAQIKQWFATKLPDMGVDVESARQLIEQMEEQLRTMTLLLIAIGSVSLLMGGAGVMNVMLMSVTERRREIGIRRAIGAARADIQRQFLLESTFLTVLGGIIGASLGTLAVWVTCDYTQWQYVVSPTAIAIGVGVSTIVGLFFGLQPAFQAARLDPITVLQSE